MTDQTTQPKHDFEGAYREILEAFIINDNMPIRHLSFGCTGAIDFALQQAARLQKGGFVVVPKVATEKMLYRAYGKTSYVDIYETMVAARPGEG